MSVIVQDDIYSGIAEQFPSIYKENGELLVEFVKAYYQHLDAKMDRDVPTLRDIDTTLTTFLVYYKKKYLADLPIDTSLDTRFIIKHIQDMYKRKGTQESLELLFKLFFNEEIEVFYPSTAILRPSDSIWGGDIYLEMLPVYTVDNYPIVRGNRIRGDISLASAFVDEVLFVNFSGSLSPILYLSNISGSFSSDDALEIVTTSNTGVETATNVGKLISGSISDVIINSIDRVPSQKLGDKVSFKSNSTGVDAEGKVTKTSQTQTGSIEYTINDGGFGYVDSTSLTASNNIDISNQVMIIDSANTPLNSDGTTNTSYVDFQPGDKIIASGSTLTYDGSSVANAPQYAVSGSAKVIEYKHPLLFIKQNTFNEVKTFVNTVNTINPNATYPTNLLFVQAFANAIIPNFYNMGTNTSYKKNFNKLDIQDGSGVVSDVNNSGTVTIDDYNIYLKWFQTINDANSTDFIGLRAGVVDNTEWGKYLYRLFVLYSKFNIFPKFVVSNETVYTPASTGAGYSGVSGDGSVVQSGVTIPYPSVTNGSFTIERHRDDLALSSTTPNGVAVKSFGVFNDTSKFNVGTLSNVETVSFIPDQIGDFSNVVLDADGDPTNDDYGMSGPGAENLNTTIADAFSSITVKIGTIDSLNVISAGSNFQNDVKTLLTHDNIVKFDKKDIILNFDTVNFFLTAGDVVTQNRTIQDISINQTNNITEAELEALGSTTTGSGYANSTTTFEYTSGGTIPYTAKAKFLKREGNDFYFRPLSFHGFDPSVQISISNNNVTISSVSEDSTSLPMGQNADIVGVASYQTGQVDEVSIVKTGYRYTDNEVVDIINLEPSSASYNQKVATATIRTLGQGRTEGNWKTSTSFLSDSSKKLHDNDYYQEYSYDVSSIIDSSKYKPLIEETVGVAGTKLFSTSLINSNNKLKSDLDVEFTFYNIASLQFVTYDGDEYVTEGGSPEGLHAQLAEVYTP